MTGTGVVRTVEHVLYKGVIEQTDHTNGLGGSNTHTRTRLERHAVALWCCSHHDRRCSLLVGTAADSLASRSR